MTIRFEPLGVWPGTATPPGRREEPRFRAGHKDTLDKLSAELEKLSARQVVIQLAITEREIRNDGWPRAGARPMSPGVVLLFESRHGSLQYQCDRYSDWKANLRAIALTLEAQRDISRWGATADGQQYQGWKALPPGDETAPPRVEVMTTRDAALRMVTLANYPGRAADLWVEPEAVRTAYRLAAERHHPDVGGNREAWDEVQAAKAILDRHHAAKAG